jgi:hypothetical protein
MTSVSTILTDKHSSQQEFHFGPANMEISTAQVHKAQLWPTDRQHSTDRRERGKRSRRRSGGSGGGKRR